MLPVLFFLRVCVCVVSALFFIKNPSYLKQLSKCIT